MATDPWRRQDSPSNTAGGPNGRMPLMEHAVKNGETLMQISLLYSVPVSEIKRVNNIVADQEIHGLPMVRVPVTRSYLLRRQLEESRAELHQQQQQPIICLDDDGPQLLQQLQKQSTSVPMNRNFAIDGGSSNHIGKYSDKVPLLDDQDHQRDMLGSNESLASSGERSMRTRQAIEGILNEADRTVASVRQNLPSPTLEGGAFHFIDAGAPDHSSNIWLIVAVVVIIFVLVPLGLTFLEETSEMEEHHSQGAGAVHSHISGTGAGFAGDGHSHQ